MENNYNQIQQAVDSILNIKTFIKRKKRTKSEQNKETFCQVINHIEDVIIRQHIIYADFDIDISKYVEKYFVIIDSLMFLHFGKDCADIIGFYLYDRMNPDGTPNPLIINDKEEVHLQTPYELWDFLYKLNPKINE